MGLKFMLMAASSLLFHLISTGCNPAKFTLPDISGEKAATLKKTVQNKIEGW
ncbi:hypothetical protein [Desulfosarcina ovata]|uniref:Lipoprotein n=1 Tax=Desulfosarcina ovata subsp. sediminis TaxID=885957 RepID=A0A5K7ZVT7_9BACT|nr:hypothetical protein [Desulfosarcina ovata]BBO84211.1 hypothetical protein DSCO28_47770 [Desulfosarcina ovata subsp. sediminis]